LPVTEIAEQSYAACIRRTLAQYPLIIFLMQAEIVVTRGKVNQRLAIGEDSLHLMVG
jgi:hypothetical protein